jgi:hypothetical protein
MMEDTMSICDFFSEMPCWYYASLILLSLYYAVRGVVFEVVNYREAPLSKTQKVIIFYIQEFLFKIIFTASAFISLAIAYKIFSSLQSLNDISAGTAILLVFLFVWGILGLSGYLTGLILAGKFPGIKGSSG